MNKKDLLDYTASVYQLAFKQTVGLISKDDADAELLKTVNDFQRLQAAHDWLMLAGYAILAFVVAFFAAGGHVHLGFFGV